MPKLNAHVVHILDCGMFFMQDTVGGVFQIVGSFGERCQCDNST